MIRLRFVVEGQTEEAGVIDYARIKRDLTLWMKEDQQSDAFFTTMFDLYRLPQDFPGFAEAKRQVDPYQRVKLLENAFAEDIGHQRFVPYLQLYEFEALVLSDPSKFDIRFVEHESGIENLVDLCSKFESPELLDKERFLCHDIRHRR